jgi:hypothetical protein
MPHLDVSKLRRLRSLEDENSLLKRLVAGLMRIPVHREHSFRFNVNTDSADGERRFRSS